jgi:hypothetical protein
MRHRAYRNKHGYALGGRVRQGGDSHEPVPYRPKQRDDLRAEPLDSDWRRLGKLGVVVRGNVNACVPTTYRMVHRGTGLPFQSKLDSFGKRVGAEDRIRSMSIGLTE